MDTTVDPKDTIIAMLQEGRKPAAIAAFAKQYGIELDTLSQVEVKSEGGDEAFFAQKLEEYFALLAEGKTKVADALRRQYKLRIPRDENKVFTIHCRTFGCDGVLTGTRQQLAGVYYCESCQEEEEQTK